MNVPGATLPAAAERGDPPALLSHPQGRARWGMLVGVEEVAPAEAPGPAGECVIATVMVGYDGHRDSVFYLAVDPARRPVS